MTLTLTLTLTLTRRAEEHKETLHKIEQRVLWIAAALAAYKAVVEHEVVRRKA